MASAVVVVLVLALPGQHCGSGYGYAASYYQYPTTYSYNNYSYAYAVPYVEKLKFVAVENYPNYSAQLVGPGIRQQQREQERKEEQAALIAELKAIRAALAERPTTPVVPPAPPPEIQAFSAPRPQFSPSPQAAPQAPAAPSYQAPAPLGVPEKSPAAMPPLQPVSPPAKGAPGYAPAPSPPPVPRPGSESSGSWAPMGRAEAQQILLSVLTNNCANCHGGGNESGGLAITDANGNPVEDLAQKMGAINEAIVSGRMPKGSPLPATQRQAFGQAVLTVFPEAVLALYQKVQR